MGYIIDLAGADELIRRLRQNYRVYAPKRLPGRGWIAGTDMIRYGEISSAAEIVYQEQSVFSPKDMLFPAIQTTQYFTAEEIRESTIDERGILLFARPCDINGLHRLDQIFLENGGHADHYYQRLRDKTRFVLIECREGWENCFCVTMGANRTDDYSMAVRMSGENWQVEVQDDEFRSLFNGSAGSDFTPQFVEKNKKAVRLPAIARHQVGMIHQLPMWTGFNDRCVSCGSCNTVCVSCSCFDTKDIIYHETSRDGERRRGWSSCMLESFTTMAGGHSVRRTAGERMRFKTMHKIYDFKARFGEAHMCVGCGRCDTRCPEKISFAETISQLGDALQSQEVSGQ